MAKFRYKYRIESTRLTGYDYAQNGAYFITICAKNHDCIFGEITVVETGLRPVSTIKMEQNAISDLQDKKNPKMILSDAGKIVSDCWFDLPNHYNNMILDEFIVMPDHIHGIIRILNIPGQKERHGLSEFIRAFKSFSSRRVNEIHKNKYDGIWQSRFYDRVIWSETELNRIRLYIKNNVINWSDDC